MYVTPHLSEHTVLVYADDDYTDATVLHRYYCIDCGLEFTGEDTEKCPGCGSDGVMREH